MILDAFAGLLTGVLTGFGVGGGTLLMIYMTAFRSVEQTVAQGINLVYFLPTSGASLVSHVKNGFIEKKAVIPAAICGTIVTVFAALLATGLDVEIVKKCFGGFLVIVGISELFRK